MSNVDQRLTDLEPLNPLIDCWQGGQPVSFWMSIFKDLTSSLSGTCAQEIEQ